MKSLFRCALLAAAFVVVSAGASHALVWSDFGAGQTLSSSGWSAQGVSANASLPWENHHWYSFEFVVDRSTTRWSIDDLAGSRFAVNSGPLEMGAIALHMTARPGFGDRISLDGLSLNGSDLGTGLLSWTPQAGEAADRWWGLADLPGEFTLAGNFRWDWAPEVASPGFADLGIGVQSAAPGVLTPPIPEPGTLMLLGSGILGLGAFVRRKAHR